MEKNYLQQITAYEKELGDVNKRYHKIYINKLLGL